MSASGGLALPGELASHELAVAHRRVCLVAAKFVRPWRSFSSHPETAVACTGSLARIPNGSVSKSGRSWSQRRHVRLAGSAGRSWHGSLQLARTRLRHTRSSFPARLFDNASCHESRVPPPRPRVVSGGPSLVLLGNVVFDSERHYPLLVCWRESKATEGGSRTTYSNVRSHHVSARLLVGHLD